MRLCDVTLREAPQLPDREYTVDQRIEAGNALDRLGVPLIQVGFPAIGEADHEVVGELADQCVADVVAIARGVEADVDAALDAGADAIEVFVPVSDRQLTHVVDQSRPETFDDAAACLDRARDGGVDVYLTLMDAFRTEVGDLAAAFERFDCPIVLADSVGARTPPFVAGFLRTLGEAGVDLGRGGVHFHDDLGCATANALVAARTGVDRVDVSVAGLGERAGNPPTEEVAVATVIDEGDPGIAEPRVVPECWAVLDALDEDVDSRKAILGEAVTTHESGIHTDAMLSEPATFEPFDPEEFGGERRLVFGAATGRGAARKLLTRAGRDPTDELVERLLDRLEEDGPLDLDRALSLAAEC